MAERFVMLLRRGKGQTVNGVELRGLASLVITRHICMLVTTFES